MIRKVHIARLAGKIERLAVELHHDVGRLRSAGHGPGAEALARCCRQLEEISIGLQQRPTRRGRQAMDIDVTELTRLIGKRLRVAGASK